jgi:ABC-type multidrug transport system fused ATPase/permease subunit
MSVLARPVDSHPVMTAMAIGLLLGENTPALPSGDEEYAIFPIAFTLSCLTIVAGLFVIWIITMYTKKEGASESTDDDPSTSISRRPSLTHIWGDISSGDNDASGTILMKWKDVSCSYNLGKGKLPTTTLHNNSGVLKEGEVTAILGPSGASKSTLLDILSGRKSLGNIGT